MIKMKTIALSALTMGLLLGLSGCSGDSNDTPTIGTTITSQSITTANKTIVLTTYANIALANYTDALNDAQKLNDAIDSFVLDPSDTKFKATKDAWKIARISYGTTEAFRLANGPIDGGTTFADLFGAPEGQLNAWPLDESMIDYTTDASGNLTSGNIIDTTSVFSPTGSEATDVNITSITKATLSALNENGGDANIATGYHAVEFLLWGQDQDYNSFIADTITNGATTAGKRNYTDYISADNVDRRKDYLVASSELIVDDLQKVVTAWTSGTGSYREAFLGSGTNAITQSIALKQVLSSIGTFVKSELANERMAVAILTPSEEDEHSCFSDNTHVDIDKNYRGFVNILKGEYKGSVQGTSFYSLLSKTTQDTLDTLISGIDSKITLMNNAVATEHFDYQIKDGSSNKSNLISIKNEMRNLGDAMVNVAKEFDISLVQDDVTDTDETQI